MIFLMCGDPTSLVDIPSQGPIAFPSPTLDFGQHTQLTCAITLQHVCRRWQQVALGLPELWAALDFGHRLPADPARIVELCVQRAGTLPLTLNLRQTDSHAQDACRALFVAVAAHPGRWKEFVLEIRDGDMVLRPLLACPPGSMCQLKQVITRTVLPWGTGPGSCKTDLLLLFSTNLATGLQLIHLAQMH